MKIITTQKNTGQENYILPVSILPEIRAEVYNKKTKKWRREYFCVEIRLTGKQLKTDSELKLSIYDTKSTK